MNTNQIKIDGFSNPDTEHLFHGFTEERVIQDAEEENYCGFCTAAWFLNPKDAGGIFCLSEDSPYRFETLDSSFYLPSPEQMQRR